MDDNTVNTQENTEDLAAEMVDVKKLLAELVKTNAALLRQQTENNHTSSKELSVAALNAIESRIQEFTYSPEEGATFERWWNRHEDIFTLDLQGMDEVKKCRLLIRHVSTSVERTFVEAIAPTKWIDLSLEQVKDKMLSLFGDNTSIFDRRRTMLDLKMSKENIDDVRTLAARVNQIVENAQVKDASIDDWKVLTFLHSLDLPRYSDVHLKMMQTAKQKGKTCTLEDLLSVYNDIAQLKKDSRAITDSSRDVNYVDRRKDNKSQKRPQRTEKPKHTSQQKECYSCGRTGHARLNCKFKDAECNHCHKNGHIEQACMSKKNKKTFTVSVASVSTSDYNIRVNINGHSTAICVDTGADITIISEKTWKEIGKPERSKADCTATCANGNKLDLLGMFKAEAEYDGITATGDIYVTRQNINLLGTNFIKHLQLIQMKKTSSTVNEINASLSNNQEYTEWVKKEFPGVTASGLGTCTEMTASLQLKPNSKPVFVKARPVPYALIEKVDTELDRLEKSGVIEKVQYSEWAAPILTVSKPNGSIRMCADFSTGLNAAIDLPAHPLPLPEDIFATLNGATIFTQIDLAEAYLQVPLDEEAQKLLVINTHKGLFRYKRLPFGVKAAPGVFQRLMDTMLSGVKHALPYLDDIIIGGRTKTEHDATLKEVMLKLQQFGLRTRAEKCSFGMKEVRFLGFIINKDGRHTDPQKTEAIRTMPEPENLSQLKSLLGMVTYNGQFIEGLHRIRGPLDNLMKKETKWKWTPECAKAFKGIKEMMNTQLSLVHYDPQKEIVVAADACEDGIGACIMHRYPGGVLRAICHASRKLKPAERNYGQIEKEALGLIYAVGKFHKYIYGRRFTLQTDHKPLVSIFGSPKGVPAYTAKRIYRWAETLLMYDFNIEYVNTNSFAYADALSRLISECQTDKEVNIALVQSEQDINGCLLSSIRRLPVTSSDIKTETNKDSLLQEVIHKHLKGWSLKDSKDKRLSAYYSRRMELSLVKGCLLFGSRVVVPCNLRVRVMKELHSEHPGIVRMKSLARSICFWPGMDQDVEQMVQRCDRCARAAKAPCKVPLQPWPKAERPWERVHIDYAGPIRGEYYLVIVDSNSKWPEVYCTQRITASITVDFLKDAISRYGIPEVLVSDNGTQFTSDLFRQMCVANGIKHITTAPYHPQSNGQAERFVDTLKRSLKKMNGEALNKEIIRQFLMTYRRTPNPNTPDGRSPGEHFLGRIIRTRVDLITPNNRSEKIDEKMKDQFDKHHGAKDRRFSIGEQIYYRKPDGPNRFQWVPGVITGRRGKVMFDIEVDKKKQRAHSNQLRKRSNGQPLHRETGVQQLPLELLLDTFELNGANMENLVQNPGVDFDDYVYDDDDDDDMLTAVSRQSTTRSSPSSSAPTTPQQSPVKAASPVPLRRSQRDRRPPTRLDVNPHMKSYAPKK